MIEQTSQRVQIWRFARAPRQFKKHFPEAAGQDWLVHAIVSVFPTIEPSLMAWRPVYPVKVVRLEDGSSLFWGAPREAIALANPAPSVFDAPPHGIERRAAVRVRIECPLRYEARWDRTVAGEGHTINLSSGGISFTTQSLLPSNIEMKLYVAWPVRLENDVPVELRATGRLVRSTPTMAAMNVEEFKFWSWVNTSWISEFSRIEIDKV